MTNSRTQSRTLPPLSGGHNLRDMGGRTTRSGYRVREGKLYRSAVMAGLNPGDLTVLSALNLRSIFNLRNIAERTSHPTPWQALGVANYDHVCADELSGDLFALLTDSSTTLQNVHTLMVELYKTLPFDYANSYRAIRLRIADGNCRSSFTARLERTEPAFLPRSSWPFWTWQTPT